MTGGDGGTGIRAAVRVGAPVLTAIALQSGSSGNCVYIESRRTRLLIDAGLPARHAERRLAAYGRDIRAVDAVLITHDHVDHVRCAGILHRKFNLPIFMTAQTLAAARRACDLGELAEIRQFQSGETIEFEDVRVETVPTPHDAADGVGFVVDAGGARVGILTDLGHVFDRLVQVVGSLDAAFLESNYDPAMLRAGPYPEPVKRRIEGPRGHLSNEDAAALLGSVVPASAKWICLSHLSQHNNSPAVALATVRRTARAGLPLFVTSRHEAVGPFEI